MNEPSQKDAFLAILRSQFPYFIRKVFKTVSPNDEYLDNWHIWAMAHQLQQAIDGQTTRLIINMPPRHMKSIATSIALPAFLLGHNPSARIICASYSSDLSIQLSRMTRTVMESDWYQELFPGTRLSPEKNTQTQLCTTKQGYRIATSVGGGLTGMGGDYLIIDDPQKAEEAHSETKRAHTKQWYTHTVSTRLNDPKTGRIILVQQRFHEDDLGGFLLEQEGWSHLNLPAIAEKEEQIPIGPDQHHHRAINDVLHPERMSREMLERKRQEMGEYAFAGQYQQRPAPVEGAIVKWSWFQFYEELPPKTLDALVIQSWDTAYTIQTMSDYTACTTWIYMNYRLYLIDVLRLKVEFPSLVPLIISHAEKFGADHVVVEAAGAGRNVAQTLKRIDPRRYTYDSPTSDKATRLIEISPYIQSGRVHLPKAASWLDDFRTELLQFPNGKNDDQVDALTLTLRWMRFKTTPAPAGIFDPSM